MWDNEHETSDFLYKHKSTYLPVVVLNLHEMPLSIGHSAWDVNPHLGCVRAGVAPGREHKFDSFILNGQRDKIMLAVVPAIV